ncbi:nuclear transport factor 2 family protein [Microbacterium sp. HD4P20]|uniref:nuclear transport factor 2 family protein n=1 Tax=Microbacterium sp. HD4P20 TaxID=2864874 RepID=UPI001C64403A|nr:nuclear transport factor 2 family protein [Microbacterium sp. HD4P20]MCP2636465.1 nuclear transport factor 2 family protein [Microbacterium sp. HD4P20]
MAEASAALAEAIVSNDADRIGALLGEEWRLIDADGPTTRARFLEVVRSGELTHSMMRPSADIEVRVYGRTAVVLARVVNTAHFGGRTFEADEWTTDVFALRDARWVCVHTHITAARAGS